MTTSTSGRRAAARSLVCLAAWGCAFGAASAALTRELVLLDGDPNARPSDSEEILLTQSAPGQPTTEFGSAVAFGDVDGDRLADVLVGQRAHNRIFVYLGSSTPRTADYFDDPNAADIVISAPAGGPDAVQQLGFSLAAADLDGDGFDDIITGAPFSDPQGRVDAGLAFVILGSDAFQTGLVIGTADPNDAAFVVKLTRGAAARAGDLLGFAVGAVALGLTPTGDPTDAFLAVSARGAEAPIPTRRPAAGAVHLVLGSALPPGGSTIDLSLDSDVTFFGSDVSDAFGESIAACDVDGSGDEDLLVGAIFGDGPSNSGINRGEALLFLGENLASGHFAGDESALSADLTINGATDGDDLGYTVACGDLNDDGLDDVVVSAIFADGAGESRPTAGEVYVFRGRGSQEVPGSSPERRVLIDPATMSPQAPIDLNPDAASPGRAALALLGATTADQLGFSLEVGDLDGDGIGDLIAGARRYDRDQTLINVGATYLMPGSAGLLGPPAPPAPRTVDLRQGTSRPTLPGFDPNAPVHHTPDQVAAIVVGASRNDHSSFDVASGDLDGDGADELLISAIGDLTQAPGFPGEAYLLWFRDGDGDGASDLLDRDSDNDGIADEDEDADGDGAVGQDETDPFDQDTDADGIQDGTELGLTCMEVGCDDPNEPFTSTDPTLGLFFRPDADPSFVTKPLDRDSDDDGLADRTEDADGDGARGPGETNAAAADTDGDGIKDGIELGLPAPESQTGMDTAGFMPDADDGATKTDPLDDDTDADGLQDGVEDLNKNGAVAVGPLGVLTETDPNDADTDDDMLPDGIEDSNRDGDRGADAGETDPLDQDTDDDGLADGWIDGSNGAPGDPVRHPLEGEDLDLDGSVDPGESDAGDHDTDDDGLTDGVERGLSMSGSLGRNGMAESGPLEDGTDPNSPNLRLDADAGSAGSVTNPARADSDGDGIPDGVEDVNRNGAVAGDNFDHIVQMGEIWMETDAADPDTDRDMLPDGLEDRNKDGDRGADAGETDPLDQDTDDDGLPDGWIDGANDEDPNDGVRTPLEGEDRDLDGNYEPALGESHPRMADSDGDALPDGLEVGLPVGGMGVPGRNLTANDADGTDTTSAGFRTDADSGITATEPFDADTDDDGLPDGFIDGHNPNGGGAPGGLLDGMASVYEGEDINLNGVVDPNTMTLPAETDPTAPENDTDNDGVRDGVERGVMSSERVLGPDGIADAVGGVQDGTAASALFDTQDSTLTDPRDGDFDDDGLSDGTEDDMGNGRVDSGETDPADSDTDGDLIPDGIEVGDTAPEPDTAGTFVPDADPATTTNPTSADTDGGGTPDGVEDADRNGRVDGTEQDPNDRTDDDRSGSLVLSVTAGGPMASSIDPNATLFLRVDDDTDENLDPNAAESIFVTCASSVSDSESVPLPAAGPDSGLFAGSISTSVSASAVNDGTLTVAAGGSIDCAYTDDDDSPDNMRTASIAVAAPAAGVPPLQISITTSGALSWVPMTAPGLTPPAMTYNLYRGRLGILAETGVYTQEALACGLAVTAHGDPAMPVSGEPIFYLVAAVAGGVEGLGVDRDGNARPSTGICGP